MTRPDDPDFAEWIKNDPPPNLQQLVKQFGDYSNITPQAWAEHDAAMARWQERRRLRVFDRSIKGAKTK